MISKATNRKEDFCFMIQFGDMNTDLLFTEAILLFSINNPDLSVFPSTDCKNTTEGKRFTDFGNF